MMGSARAILAAPLDSTDVFAVDSGGRVELLLHHPIRQWDVALHRSGPLLTRFLSGIT